MSWDGYDKDTREKLKNSPQIIDAINNMRDKGYSKEQAQKVTGAPYEVVDRIFNISNRQRSRTRDSGRGEDE